MCPFSCSTAGPGATLCKALVIALLASGVAMVHATAHAPLKLEPEKPPPLDPKLLSPATPAVPGPAAPADKAAPEKGTVPAGGGAPAATPAAKEQPPAQPGATQPAPATGGPRPQPVPPAEHAASMLDLDTVKQLQARIFSAGDVSFIDARNADEFAQGRIPGAENVPPDALSGADTPKALEMVPMSNTVVVYCNGGTCDASKLTAIRLQERGYTKVYVFEGGMAAWSAAGLQIEK